MLPALGTARAFLSRRCISSLAVCHGAPRQPAASTSSSSWTRALLHHPASSLLGAIRFAVGDVHKVKVPVLGDSIKEGSVMELCVADGSAVNLDDPLVVLETGKANNTVRAPVAGTVSFKVALGATVAVDSELLTLVEGAAPPAASAPKPKAAADAPPPPPPPAAAAAAPSPAAAATPAAKAPAAAPKSAPPMPASSSAPLGSRQEHRESLSRMRKTIANRLKETQNTAALLTTFQECDMSGLMALRDKHKDEFLKKHGVKLGFMSAFVKASTSALRAHPIVNARIDDDAIVYHDYCDISVAVATPTGLAVPVLRNTECMSFADVEKAIAALGERARKNKIEFAEMAGGTFTISNGGVYGSLMGTPIVNPPQTAILGMHNIEKRAVVVNDEIVIRPMMYLALTYDHRLIDGRDAVTFLRHIKFAVEDPSRLLFEL
eukprot:gnl/Spiro4/3774_TR1856_c0_g1_i1.p1 gnl/Spiro4/3774_TR1856_c0_g1~~gnl/Spiro4/3774_TR1856_c0_g1_i1.p1  ORF type:complete len:435 (+),score=112.83 gnl/Spiro4/3774_TR1856_c0_g1_i1:87-1391(+)